jgi:hypothetical protein
VVIDPCLDAREAVLDIDPVHRGGLGYPVSREGENKKNKVLCMGMLSLVDCRVGALARLAMRSEDGSGRKPA